MSPLKNRKKSFDLVPFFPVFIFCLLLSFSAILAFQYFYFPQRYVDLRVAEMQEVFTGEESFADRARSILDTRSDVGYIRLLDHNGVLEKSLGFREDKGFEKFTLKGPEGKTVLLGLKSPVSENFPLDALLWSLAFSSLIAAVLTFLVRLVSNRAFRFLGEFSEAVGAVSRGDYSVRLDRRSSLIAGTGVEWLCRDFNEMISSLEGRPTDRDGAEHPEVADPGRSAEVPTDFRPKEDENLDRSAEVPTDFRPKIVLSHEQSPDVSPFQAPGDPEDSGLVEIVHADEDTEDSGLVEIVHAGEDTEDSGLVEIVHADEDTEDSGLVEILHAGEDTEDSGLVEILHADPEQEVPSAVAGIAGSGEKRIDISILVVKIADFEALMEDVSPSGVNSLTADYRKSVSTAIGSFGGTVETVLRDEVVASFSSSGPGPGAKLSCVCCAVEIIRLFAGVVDGKKTSGPSDIKLKMGIASADLSVSDGLDVFALAKPSLDEARALCDGAKVWNIFVTTGFREGASDYLYVNREEVDGNLCYAVTGVEEEALQLTGK